MPTQKKASRSKIPSRKHLPTPTPRAHTRAGLGRQSEGKWGRRRGTNSGTKAQGTGNLTGQTLGGLGTGRRGSLRSSRQPQPPAGGLRRQLGLQRAGPGPGCLFARPTWPRLWPPRTGWKAPGWGSDPRGLSGRQAAALARRARLRVSPKGQAGAAGQKLGPGGGGRAPRGPAGVPRRTGHLLLLSRGLLLEHLCAATIFWPGYLAALPRRCTASSGTWPCSP